ncbi:homeodomain leucin zipper protein [Klebsormidium nitens]|uniref:Homeodomain leucin zipper protein n=1 Tax=Klebsormidium nitens TaxID=105231 RepID=A0A1Y1HYZ4_KLENI|nr:homeodomain leucin zipper protein [Klebsormidium nitens]|eukprot:GAQ82962.1 homeodomain leucin zipper protein [Klebsormidium nitens]
MAVQWRTLKENAVELEGSMLAPGGTDFSSFHSTMQETNSDNEYNTASETGGSKGLHHPQPQLPVNGVTLHFPNQGNSTRGFHLPPIIAPPMTFDTTWQLSPATAQMAYDMVFNRQPSPSANAMRPQVMRMQDGLGQLTSLTTNGDEGAFQQVARSTDLLVQPPHLMDSLNRNPVSAPLTVNLTSGSDVNAPIDVNMQPPQRDEGDSAGQSEEFDDDDVKPSVSGRKRDAQGGGEESVTGRKKLKLSKEQAELLEKAFRENNTLNPAAKSTLATKLNLRARQVEVWFQNRRARTKLKQTEVDCEVLKRCCETLTEENRRLQKELSELRASQGQSGLQEFLGHMPAATLSMCPSCERLTALDPVRGSVIINRGNNQYER